jgi:plastocyanin
LLCSLLACSGGEPRETPGSRDDAFGDTGSPRESARPPAYETVTVDDGGAVAGIVRLSASLPPPVETPVLKDQATCGEHTPDPSLELGKENTIANVVVSLVGVTQGKEMPELTEPAKLDQRQCVYIPHIQIVSPGTSVDIYNSDPILHNVHAFMNGSTTIFNLALPIQGFRIRRRLDDPGLVSLKCDAGHTWMSGYIVVQGHPYYALTKADGAYLIGDVPPGEYQLRTWHEWLGESEVKVVIEADTTTKIELELTAPEDAGH